VWSSVLVLALLAALNPVRLGLALLVISRPRPVQNLLAYWVGCLVVSVVYMLVPLMVLHFTPGLRSFAHDVGTPGTVTSSTVRHIQIGMGVFALSVAVLMAVRLWAGQRARVPAPGRISSTPMLDSNTPTAISWLEGRPTNGGGQQCAQNAPRAGASAIRRLLDRAHNAWENGSLWVPSVIGFILGPAPDTLLFVLAIIVASGAAIGTQLIAAIAFIFASLAVVEAIPACYLVAPAKTQAVVQLLHDWAESHRRQVLTAIFAVVGAWLIAHGMGSV
jgi:hypothetical protein